MHIMSRAYERFEVARSWTKWHYEKLGYQCYFARRALFLMIPSVNSKKETPLLRDLTCAYGTL